MIELPTLYAKRQDGKIKQWSAHTENDLVCMSHGMMGKKITVTKTRALPTNTGRANARNGAQQAQFEAQAAWTKKKDEGYFETVALAETTKIILPMLAHNAYVERTRKGQKFKELRAITFPLDAQRKLNGLRCIATRNKLISREGVEWNIPHIQNHIKLFLSDDSQFLDGEVYIHGVPLQTLNSLIKDYRLPESAALEFHAYDMPAEDKYWEQRYAQLVEQFTYYDMNKPLGLEKCIKLVETIRMNCMGSVEIFEKVAVEVEGYEGLILRQLDRPYRFNFRCDSLLKWKRFQDAEFLIVDVLKRELVKPTGSLWICDKFVCRNNINDRTFEVVPKGTENERAEFLANKEFYIGKQGVVRFLERSNDGIPQGNPVLTSFRLDSDLPAQEEEMWS